MKTYSILALAVMALWVGSANAKYTGGTGEPNDPYRIATPEDLNDIGNHEEDWDKHFILVNDVNLAGYTGIQFKIIGRYGPDYKPFTGVFDGNDNRIWNFTWTSNDIDFVGMFRCVGAGAQIKNLGMENVNVKTIGGNVGGLVGQNWEGSITNCYSTGHVTGLDRVGGLVGENHLGSITNCYAKGNVSGNWDVGGLVGKTWEGAITNCYSTGNVWGDDELIGGLVGYNYQGTITNCYSTGNVWGGDELVGGLVGENAGTITNCYSTGRVTANYEFGGLVGLGGVVVNSFWDIETSGQLTSAGGEPKTTAEMKTIDTFTDAAWDFVEIWGIGENQTYPFLRTEPAGDLDHDKKVDLIDLAILASHWLEGP